MLGALDVFLLVIYATPSIAGPLPRISNASTADVSVLTPSYSTSSGGSTFLLHQPLDSSASINSVTISIEEVTSSTAALSESSGTPAVRHTLSATSISRPQGLAATSTSFSFRYSPPHGNSTGATGPTAPLRTRSHTFSESTTTVTRFTTVVPGPSSIVTSSSAADGESNSKGTEPNGGTSSKNATYSASQSVSSSSTNMSPLVYGSITLTYTASGQTDSPSLIVSQVSGSSSAASSQMPASRSGTSETAGSGRTSSFAYPIPETTSPSQAAGATIGTTASSPAIVPTLTTQFSSSTIASTSSSGVQQPSDSQGGQQVGLPNIITTASPASSTTAVSSMNAQGGGITIIPVNPNAVTVTVTTTEIDAGMTTTVAEQTVTVNG